MQTPDQTGNHPPGAPPPPPRPDNMGRDASRSFLSGFAGCLGVGLAIVAVMIVIVMIGVIAHGH